MVAALSLLLIPCFVDVLRADCVEESGEFPFSFNSWDVVGPLDHFWRSAGFCPPDPHPKAADWMLSSDMQQNLAYMGAVPHRGIEQVRIHYLLELVKVQSVTEGRPNYDFKDLDALIQLLYENGLKPGFEIMGNPSSFFTDMENKTQVYLWRDLVAQIATRYTGFYGLSYVETWNFESWNEPDCGGFDKLNMTRQGFLNYYDACSEGLKSVSQSLILGGPGGGCDEAAVNTYSDALFEHVTSGRNYFTGETGVRLDYMSIHRKGRGEAGTIIDEERFFYSYLTMKYPQLTSKLFYNDESDPLGGWNKDEKWRASSAYAAIAAKIIGQQQNIFKAKDSSVNYGLLSNDNGFLSYYPHQFTQRTLLARFQMNNTKEPYVTWQSAFFVYNSCDIGHGMDWGNLDLTWKIRPPAGNEDLRLMIYTVGPLTGDPYGVWTNNFNSTAYPTLNQFKRLWREGNPAPVNTFVEPNATTVLLPPRYQILTDTMAVFHLCAKSKHVPEPVTGLRFVNITVGQVLVVWSDDNIKTKCIGTYDVEYSPSELGPFTRVNQDNTIVTATVVAPESKSGKVSDNMVRGYYRVRAVDYFDRPGSYSQAAKY